MKTPLLTPLTALLIFTALPSAAQTSPNSPRIYSRAEFANLDRYELRGKAVQVEVTPFDLRSIAPVDEKFIKVSLADWGLVFPRGSKEKLEALARAENGYVVLHLQFPPVLEAKIGTLVSVTKVEPLSSVARAGQAAKSPTNAEQPLPRPHSEDAVDIMDFRNEGGVLDHKIVKLRLRGSEIKSIAPSQNYGKGSSAVTVGFAELGLKAEGTTWLQTMAKRRMAQIDVYALIDPAYPAPIAIGSAFKAAGPQHAIYTFPNP